MFDYQRVNEFRWQEIDRSYLKHILIIIDWNIYSGNLKMTIEIVDLPIENGGFSIVM